MTAWLLLGIVAMQDKDMSMLGSHFGSAPHSSQRRDSQLNCHAWKLKLRELTKRSEEKRSHGCFCSKWTEDTDNYEGWYLQTLVYTNGPNVGFTSDFSSRALRLRSFVHRSWQLVVMLSLFQYCQSLALAISTGTKNKILVDPIINQALSGLILGSWCFMFFFHSFPCSFRKCLEDPSRTFQQKLEDPATSTFQAPQRLRLLNLPWRAESVSQTLRKAIKPAQDQATRYH